MAAHVPGAEHHSVPWRHGGTGHPRQRQAAPGLASPSACAPSPRQRHGGVTAPESPVSDASPRNLIAVRANVTGANEEGDEEQIEPEDLVRRREAVQIRHISSPARAGDGRNKAATAEAISAS